MTLIIALPDSQPKTYERLDAAIKFANDSAAKLQVELEVVDVESETVMHVATYVAGRYFHPWERVETPKFSAPHFQGWRPAYTRKRIEATVYRSYDAENMLPWRVFDGRTKNFRDVANTTESRKLLTAMKNGLML